MNCDYRDIEERRHAYESVAPERIREAAEVIFTPENLTLTLKGKRSLDLDALRAELLRL